MKTDRELLELAAKAAGLKMAAWREYTNADPTMVVRYEQPIDGISGYEWNPLTDDGDALRLACTLGIEIYPRMGISGNLTTALCPPELGLESLCERHGTNANAATRRAIVRAAAAIGEQTK